MSSFFAGFFVSQLRSIQSSLEKEGKEIKWKIQTVQKLEKIKTSFVACQDNKVGISLVVIFFIIQLSLFFHTFCVLFFLPCPQVLLFFTLLVSFSVYSCVT